MGLCFVIMVVISAISIRTYCGVNPELKGQKFVQVSKRSKKGTAVYENVKTKEKMIAPCRVMKKINEKEVRIND